MSTSIYPLPGGDGDERKFLIPIGFGYGGGDEFFRWK